MGGSLSLLLVEDTEDAGSNLVVNDGLVVFTDNVNAKLLIKCGWLVKLCMTLGEGGNDLRRCRRTSIRTVPTRGLHH